MAYNYVGFNGPLSITSNAILAQQVGIQTTAANIANADAPGYHRNDVVIQSSGAVGGVEAAILVRAGNVALEQQQTVEVGNKAAADYRSLLLQQQVKPLLGTTDPALSIGGALSELFKDLQSLAADPANSSIRGVVAGDALVLSSRINTIANNLYNQQLQLNQTTETIVNSANVLLETVADLNNRITEATAAGIPTGDMEDQRDNCATDLAKLVGSHVLWDSNGQMRIVVGMGISLVSSVQANLLSTSVDPNTSATHIALADSQLTDIDSQITGGQAAAIIEVRDSDLGGTDGFRAQLDNFAGALATAFNTVHEASYSGPNTLGLAFFTHADSTDAAPNGNANEITFNPLVGADSGALLAAAGAATANSGDGDGAGNLVALNSSGNLQNTLGLIITAVGTTMQQATNNVDREQIYLQNLGNLVQSQSGVNMEEQMLQLSRYQTAFTAATRIVTTVDQMLQALLAM